MLEQHKVKALAASAALLFLVVCIQWVQLRGRKQDLVGLEVRYGQLLEEKTRIVEVVAEEPVFEVRDITLSPELQLHTWNMCKRYQTTLPTDEFYDLVLRVMWHESRYIADVPDYHNTNGTRDRGLMQINSVNWAWLADDGLDVNKTEDNIEAGVRMLAQLLEDFTVEHALTAYCHGRTGAYELGGSSTFAQVILTLPEEAYLA